MATTFTKIADVTVGSGGAATIDFTSIPSTYTDLCLYISSRDSSTADAKGQYYTIKFNNTGTTYAARFLQGTGTGTASGTLAQLGGISTTASTTASTFNNDSIYIPNYAGSAAKTYSIDTVTENNATGAYATFVAGSWTGTSAINQVTLTPSTGGTSFVQYTSATLYGIKNS